MHQKCQLCYKLSKKKEGNENEKEKMEKKESKTKKKKRKKVIKQERKKGEPAWPVIITSCPVTINCFFRLYEV